MIRKRRETMNNNEHPITLQLTVTITALVHPEPEVGGYSAEVPALPGCYTEGETLEEVRANLREAVEGWLSSAHDGETHRRAAPEQSR
jgi:predicted RNase H-like HicB family nuclease